MKRILVKSKWQLACALIFAAAFLLQATNAHAANAAPAKKSCAGCEDVDKVAAKYKKTEGKRNDDQTADLNLEAQDAVEKMGRSKKLSQEQIEHVVELLKLSTPSDPVHAIIDSNFQLFKVNQKAFYEEFKKHPRERDAMETALDVKLGEDEFGQDF